MKLAQFAFASAGAVAAISILLGFGTYAADTETSLTLDDYYVTYTDLVNIDTASRDIDRQVAAANKAIVLTNKLYVNELTENQLLRSAVKGLADADTDDPLELTAAGLGAMMRALDPHSAYITPKGYTAMQSKLSGEFGGLGIEISRRDSFIYVVAPLDGTPAFNAGVHAGDYITHLNGESIAGISVIDAVKRMRGKKGTSITLTIARGQPDILDVSIDQANGPADLQLEQFGELFRPAAVGPGSALDQAGIKAGDIITHINKEAVAGLALDKLRAKIKSAEKLEIKIHRQKAEILSVPITRDKIIVNPVKAHLDNNIGYIRISSFTKRTKAGVDEAFAMFRQQQKSPLKGLVIDLRSNPGGLLSQAVSVTDEFLEGGPVVSIRSRVRNQSQTYNATPGEALSGVRIAVLVNGGSASAAEILAGALQDTGRGTVFGQTTFGKGSVQSIINLGNGGAIKLTTALFATPNDRLIQGQGIVPDVKVNGLPGLTARRHEADLDGTLKIVNENITHRQEEIDGASCPPPTFESPLGRRLRFAEIKEKIKDDRLLGCALAFLRSPDISTFTASLSKPASAN